MSARSEIADRIAAKICEWKLTNPFGGEVSKNGKYYGILFAVPRYLDGFVRVYGPKWILVEGQGPLARYGNLIFESEENCLAFIHAAYVECNSEKAGAVPSKLAREVGRQVG